MAHFIGEVSGCRGPASRLGSKASGIEATAASWEGAVTTRIWYDAEAKRDVCTVSLREWHGRGTSRLLYSGPVSGMPEEK